jgi:hypothetical protein
MKKFFNYLGIFFLSLVFAFFLNVGVSQAGPSHGIQQTLNADLIVNGTIVPNHNLIQFAGSAYTHAHPTLSFNVGDSQLKEMGDLYIMSDDFIHLGPTHFDIGKVLIQNVQEINSLSRRASGTLAAGRIEVDTIAGNNAGYLRVAQRAVLNNNLSVGGSLYVDKGTTLASNLRVTGTSTLSSTLAVTGATTLASNLNVGGNTTLANTGVSGNLAVTGSVTSTGNLVTLDTLHIVDASAPTNSIAWDFGQTTADTLTIAYDDGTSPTSLITIDNTGLFATTGGVNIGGALGVTQDITFANAGNRAIGIAQSVEDVAGRSLSVGAGNAGATTGAGLAGGDLYLFAGSPSTGGNAGDVWMFTDHGGSLVNGGSTHGGDIYIATGNGVGAAGNAGDIIIQPGNGAGTGSAGALLFANDKNQTIKVDRSAIDAHGMDLTISAGQGGLGVTNGGDMILTAGSGNGGDNGAILIGATNTDHIHIGTILILENGEGISNDIDNNITFSNDTDNDLTFEMQAGTNKDFIIDLDGSGHTWVKRFPMHMVFTVPGRNDTASTMGVRANTFSKALVVDRFDVYNQSTPGGGATPANDVVVTVTGDAAQSCTVAGNAGAGAGCSQTTDVALATLSNALTVNIAANGADDSANTYTVVLTYFYDF